MSLKSFLGIKDKGNEGPSNCPPKLPSNRDILEDIESIKKNDPILSLAAILHKNKTIGRHSVVDTDIKELMEAMQKRKRRESQSSLPSSQPSSPPATPALSPFLRFSADHLKLNKELDRNEDNAEEEGVESYINHLDYDKLKHFLTTCEHSQELISTIESEIKRFQAEVAENHLQQQENLLIENESILL